MGQVPATATPLTRDALAATFLPAYLEVFGELPDRNRAELLLALVYIENAQGKSIIQHNWGNLATVPSAGGDYWRPPWFDRDQIEALPEGPKRSRLLELHRRMQANAAPQAFRAFGDHTTGARAWLRLLQSPRMAPVLAAASSGNATAFAHAIFSSGYCPDPECKAAGPSYAAARDQIHAASYFDGLQKKKVLAAPPRRAAGEPPGLWSSCSAPPVSSPPTSGTCSAAAVEYRPTGEP